MPQSSNGPASYFPSIEKKYGRPIGHWKELITASPLTRHGELVTWLKSEHALGHGHANALVAHTLAENGRRLAAVPQCRSAAATLHRDRWTRMLGRDVSAEILVPRPR